MSINEGACSPLGGGEEDIEQGQLSNDSIDSASHVEEGGNSVFGIEHGSLALDDSRLQNNDLEEVDVSTHFLPAESPTKKRKTFSFGSSSGDKNCSDELSVEIDETQDDDDQLSSPSPKQIDDLKTALHNRDSLIKRLSTSLQQVYTERVEDAKLTAKLEDQMKCLREQVKLAKEKNIANRCLKERNSRLMAEKDELLAKLESSNLQLNQKDALIKELQIKDRIDEISIESKSTDLIALETKHKQELEALEEKYKNELDMIEEQRVIEMNMLDAELLTLREEKNLLADKLCKYENGTPELNEFKQVEEKQKKLLEEAQKERIILVSKVSELDKLYKAEKNARISLETNLQEMSSFLDETQYNFIPLKVRESLERSLRLSQSFNKNRDVVTPPNVTQSELDDMPSPKEGESQKSIPTNHENSEESEVVKNIKEQHMKEMSELRRYFENYCRELEVRYRNEFEEHLSQFASKEGGAPLILPPLCLDISQGKLDLSELESISPRSLDSSQLNSLGYQGQLSGQESDGGTYYPKTNGQSNESSPRKPQDKPANRSLNASLLSARPNHQRQLDVSPRSTSMTEQSRDNSSSDEEKKKCGETRTHPSLTAEISRLSVENARLLEDLSHRDNEIAILKDKVGLLEGEVSKLEAVIFEDDNRKYQDIVDNLEAQHREEIERVNNEHETQVKEFLESHKTELQKMKAECTEDLKKLKTEHAQELASLHQAHQLELAEARKNGYNFNNPVDNNDYSIIKNLESDLKVMEEEKANLKGMQSLMKDLISDLALHYSLSEKQVQFLNNTSLLDSFMEGRTSSLQDESLNPLQTPWKFFPGKFQNNKGNTSDVFSTLRDIPGSTAVNTPNQSILSMEEMSDLIRNGTFLSELENSEEVLKELQRQVRQSNEKLRTLEPGSLLSKLSGLLTPPESAPDTGPSSGPDSGGSQLGRLEVEKVRLELELAAAKQKLQELEIVGSSAAAGRNSFSRDEVMSGVGGDSSADESQSRLSDVESFREIRERAAKFLSQNLDSSNLTVANSSGDAVELLSQLLLCSDQMNNQAKIQVEDLTQQLDVADKQLRSTRLFLEEQAAERELEREEWEKKLDQAKNSQEPKLRYSDVYSSQEVVKQDVSDSEEKQDEDKADYDALVEKVFQLREIIRGLEKEAEDKSKTIDRKSSEVDELRGALMDSLMKQEAVQKELEVLRNSSTDKDMIDLIEGLKEQLSTKSQELVAHKAAHQHLSDVKAHIRGLQERVEQSTRELETSVIGQTSPSSSRSSSPLLKSGISFEDVGTVEIEEVARLEKKLVQKEKVEASAVKKIQALEAELNILKAEALKLKTDHDKLSKEIETGKSKFKQLETDYSEERKLNAKLETELISMKGFNLEDLQAENAVLQDRVLSLQFQVSTLQAEKQASKHRKPSQSSEMEFIIKERAELNEILEKTKDSMRSLELERDCLQERCNNLVTRIGELESDLDNVYKQKHGGVNTGGRADTDKSIERLVRDKNELEEINAKLLKELGQARASVLAAQKVKISKIADDLIREKNAEIDGLKQQLNEMSKQVSRTIETTPVSWASSVNSRSVEQLREAHNKSLPLIPELSLHHRADYMSNKLPSPLTEHFEEVAENTLNLRSPKRSPRDNNRGMPIFSAFSSPAKSTGSKSGTTSVLSGTQTIKFGLSQPKLDLTQENGEDKPDSKIENENSDKQLLEQKTREIEQFKESIVEKDGLIKMLTETKENSENALGKVEKEISEAKEKYNILMNKYEDSAKLVENLKNQLIHTEEILFNKENEIIDTKQSLEAKESSLSKLNTQLTAKQERIDALESKTLEGAEPNLADEVRQLRDELDDRIRGMENLHTVMEMTEAELEAAKNSESALKTKYSESQEALLKLQNENDKLISNVTELNGAINKLKDELSNNSKEKEKTEAELTRVRREMSAVDAVVKEMTSQFKQESQSRILEVQTLQDKLRKYQEIEIDLESKYSKLEIDYYKLKEDYTAMQETLHLKHNAPKPETGHLSFNESGDAFNRLFNRELEMSGELDQSLLNQLISANTSLNSTDEPTEIQRLLHKIQEEGVRVLSLSERLFLTNQVHDENMRKSLENKSLHDATRRLELMRFDIEQEKMINKDLQSALDSEKQNSLELLSKLSEERKRRSNLEDELNSLQRQIRSLENKLRDTSYAADSDNAEYLITIDTQKEQIESLEESLKMERENFNQLQNVLAVERKRNSLRDVAQERRDEDDISELRNQLRTERQYREQLETNLGSGKSGEVAKLIISRLHAELDTEHRKVRDLTTRLNQEKKKYTNLYHDLRYQNTESQQSSEVGSVDNFDESWNRVWRTRELELERLVADLELKVEILETANSKSSETIANLQIQLQEEREKESSGLSCEQLERMKQVNSFLEHNLKENGEMLATISRLQNERHELKNKLYQAQLQPLECAVPASTDYYSKFLRSESYRKALIWQKKYLLAQMSSGYFVSEPVMRINPPNLHGVARFRSVVQMVISVHRMKFMVKRWRSGKRAPPGKHGRDRTMSLQYGSLETRSMSSMSKKRPDTLSLSMETQSLISSPILHQPRSHGLRRASSMRERPSMARSVDSPGSMSSTASSALFRPPMVTGRTPPTRDMDSRGRLLLPRGNSAPRRILDSWFQQQQDQEQEDEMDSGPLPGLDEDLVADIREYQQQYSKLEKQLGIKF